jgi:hypothetical protein
MALRRNLSQQPKFLRGEAMHVQQWACFLLVDNSLAPPEVTVHLEHVTVLEHCDEIFSKQIRERDNWRCVRCRRSFAHWHYGLHCSHFHGRSHKATRFDPFNCDAVCWECHPIWEADKNGDYKIYKLQQLGKAGYEALERKARSTIKFGAFEQAQKLKELKHATTTFPLA